MYLKDFISALQELYETFDAEYIALAGEPEVAIDRFDKVNSKSMDNMYQFKGITPDIQVRRSYEGVFLVLTPVPLRKKTRKPRVTKK